MVSNLFEQFHDAPSAVPDPYAQGGLRVWDDYQFLRKGRKGGGPPLDRPSVPTAAPINVILPVISDSTPVVGSPLTVTTGTWTGTATIVYTYEWYERTAVVTPAPPVNTVAPGITGNPWIGRTLNSGTGTWTGTPTPTYSYAWKYTGGAPVPGAGTTSSYVIQPGDLGMAIYCEVTATNALGSASATTVAKGPITEPPPAEALTDELGETLTHEGEDLTVLEDA